MIDPAKLPVEVFEIILFYLPFPYITLLHRVSKQWHARLSAYRAHCPQPTLLALLDFTNHAELSPRALAELVVLADGRLESLRFCPRVDITQYATNNEITTMLFRKSSRDLQFDAYKYADHHSNEFATSTEPFAPPPKELLENNLLDRMLSLLDNITDLALSAAFVRTIHLSHQLNFRTRFPNLRRLTMPISLMYRFLALVDLAGPEYNIWAEDNDHVPAMLRNLEYLEFSVSDAAYLELTQGNLALARHESPLCNSASSYIPFKALKTLKISWADVFHHRYGYFPITLGYLVDLTSWAPELDYLELCWLEFKLSSRLRQRLYAKESLDMSRFARIEHVRCENCLNIEALGSLNHKTV